jgi:type I restriction enzyme M protein
MPAFGKTRPLAAADFAGFEADYGTDPKVKAERTEKGEGGRWRKFTRQQIAARNDNLDITWLRDTEAKGEEELSEPDDIADAIIGHLKAALAEIEMIEDELERNTEDGAVFPEAAE